MFATGVKRVIGTVHIPGVSAPVHREFKFHNRPAVGVAHDNIGMLMVQADDHVTPANVTPTLTVSQDGGTYGAKDAGSSVAQIGTTGTFQLDLAGADVVAKTFLKLSEGTADDSFMLLHADLE